MFIITVIWVIFVCYNHKMSLVNYAKPNQEINFVCYNCEFVITVIVITVFDCICKLSMLQVISLKIYFDKK